MHLQRRAAGGRPFCSTGLFVSMLVGSLIRHPPQFSVSAQGRRGDTAAAAEELCTDVGAAIGRREGGGSRRPLTWSGLYRYIKSGDREGGASRRPLRGVAAVHDGACGGNLY